MKNNLPRQYFTKFLFATLIFAQASVFAQPAFQWDKTFGGDQGESLNSIRQTADGGFIAAGITLSGQNGDKSQAGYGGRDIWIVKMTADGSKEWDLTLGGEGDESNSFIEVTSDGGYIVGATSASGAGPVKSQPVNGTEPSEMYDYWIIKLGANGAVEWDKTIGGPGKDLFNSLKPTKDGGYILAGNSNSEIGNDKTKSSLKDSRFDHWIVKISSTGEVQWDNVLGRDYQGKTYDDTGAVIELAADGGYIVGGYQGPDENYSGDYYFAKLSEKGSVELQKTFGGYDQDALQSVQQTNDGGYLLGGWSASPVGLDKSKSSGIGSPDYWIVKMDAQGKKLWDKTFDAGGNNISHLRSIAKTDDGGFLLGGTTYSEPGRDKSEPSRGYSDYWVIRIDANGTKLWDKTAGSSGIDRLSSLIQSTDGGIILGGTSNSPKGYEKSEDGRGETDFWIVKMAPEANPVPVTSVSINAGGGAYAASGGRQFLADQYYIGIDRTSAIPSGDIVHTTDDILYRSGRCSPRFNYSIPMLNGRVNVILHFAEIWYGVPGRGVGGIGKRQFNVDIEGVRKLTNFDIFAAAGGAMRAVQKSIPVTITDGVLSIDFLTGAADLPRISAIEVIRTSLTLKPLADAYVRDGSYNATNFGTAANLEMKYLAGELSTRRSSYLKFQLPPELINSARLRIYGHNHENNKDISLHAYGVDDDSWTENGISKSNAPAATTPSLGYAAVNDVYKYYEVNVTSYIKAQQQSGENTVTLLLADPNNRNTRVVFNSRENAIHPPQLIVQTPPVIKTNTRLNQAEISAEMENPVTEESTIYPNPVKDKLTVSVSMQHAGKISFELLNESGKDYAIPSLENAGPGEKTELDISGFSLSTGIYLLKIKSEAFTEVVKMLVVK